MAEQTIHGQWIWKNYRFHLEWWKPTLGCIPRAATVEKIWVRAVGIPLHLWSKKVFKEIGEICEGWVATEEEIELKNHMKWARILVSNDGSSIPREVAISRNGVKYHFPIWAECKPRYEIMPEKPNGGDETHYPEKGLTQWVREESLYEEVQKSLQIRDSVKGQHVGTAGKSVSPRAHGRHMSHLNETSEVGCSHKPILKKPQNLFKGPDLAAKEVYAKMVMTTTEFVNGDGSPTPNEEVDWQKVRNCDNRSVESDIYGIILRGDNTNIVNWEVEEVEPIMMQQQHILQGREKETSIWVQQNLIKLGKIFGVDFQGLEEEATELLMQIDGCRQARRMEQDIEVKKSRIKGAQELKSLVSFDVKYKNTGDRNKGRNASSSSRGSSSRPGYVLACKLKALKHKLKEWRNEETRNLGVQRKKLLEQMADLDTEREDKVFTDEEIAKKFELLLKYEELLKKEEISWTQKSRVLW
ncbi:hypothetical protein MTR67_030782 [Solanum verrucosum]|uniref:DUF4283 domain-containing protein n=1 Tax=Solanum verrucosum TaxID=315347 RepID=A0AAF0ZDX4_SOLVR|nr:hypothetical protein MTR67_030782 [Solanum verrucosum]